MSRSGSGKPDPDLEGEELFFPPERWISYFWCQNGAVFEWIGSGLYEPNYWIHLQSKVLKYIT